MMYNVPIVFDFEIKSLSSVSPELEIKNILDHWQDVQPYKVVVDDDKAAYIEFGTSPAKNTSPKYGAGVSSSISPVEEKFRKWVKEKKGISNQEACAKLARAYYKHAMEYGLPPMPFFRSSIFKVMDEIEDMDGKSKWLDTGTIESLAETIAETMIDTIYELDLVYSGDLAASIRVEPYEGTDSSTIGSNSEYGPEYWVDPELGVNGKRPPARFYGN